MKILLIDDDRAVRTSIRIVLKNSAFDVVEAENGADGLEKAKSTDIALVMVDLFMPGLHGLTVISQLHKLKPALPIIAMSGSIPSADAGADEFKTANDMGATAVLRKPFRPGELTAAINKALGR